MGLSGAAHAVPEVATLRSLKGEIVVVECKSCRLHEEMERKVLVTRFTTSFPLSRLRRFVVGGCERMCADGLDRCDARLTSKDPDD